MDNATPKRHVGYVKSTGSPVVIVAMSNPNHPGYALVTQTDTLPDQFHEYLMDAVESSAGQGTINFYEFMDRRPSPDHNLTLLRSFNARGLIREELTSNIMMTPTPTQAIELDDLLAAITGKKQPSTKTGVSEINRNADDAEERIALATNLIGQANMLEADAKKKREEAYKIAPSLKPVESISFMENKPTMEIDPSGTVNITIPEDKFLD